MDGPWQIGAKTPEEYARLAEEVGRALKRFDPSLELVACGSSNRAMPTFGTWERVVLERAFDQVDHISAHVYYEPIDGDTDSFLASGEDMDRFINSVVATADHIAAVKQSDKRIMVSFDEWNVWFQERFGGEASLEFEEGRELIRDVYSVLDAVVVGSLLITLMRHTDRVAMACQAQLVNVIAPILTVPGGPAWRQTIFHPFALTARYAQGVVLSVGGDIPSVATPAYGDVDQIWSTATWDAESGALTVFAVNRSRTEDCDLDLDLSAFGAVAVEEHLTIHDEDHAATNTEDDPERVVPQPGSGVIEDGHLRATLPAVSWHCIRITPSATASATAAQTSVDVITEGSPS
jgi:alpha-N-arabinofuranosidase